MIDWDKLKHEWKTFAWAIVSVAIECWDVILSAQLGYVDPLIPPNYQWVTHVAIPVGFLILRRWKEATKED